jgi:hypothetical protein
MDDVVSAYDGLKVGGPLLGHVEGHKFIVEHVVGQAPGRDRTSTSTEIPVERSLEVARSRGLRFIGDWHVHGRDSGTPSPIDERAWTGLRGRDAAWLGVIVTNGPDERWPICDPTLHCWAVDEHGLRAASLQTPSTNRGGVGMATVTRAKGVKVANGVAAPDDVVVCLEAFNSSALGEPFPCAAGTRLLASHPIVRACAPLFCVDATLHDEQQRLRQDLWREAEAGLPAPPPPRTRVEHRIADKDALLERGSGRRVRKDGLEARNHPQRFVEINPNKIPRGDAVVALTDLTLIGDDLKTERTIHTG